MRVHPAARAAFCRFRDTGDAAAMAKVFDLVAQELLLVACHVAGRGQEPEDLLQETFLLAIEKAERYDAARPLEPWLLGILVNVARSDRRRRSRKQQPIDSGDVVATPADGFAMGNQNPLVAATSHFNYELWPWTFEATLSGSCFVGASAAGGSAARLGRQSILVELHAAQPMKIRATLATTTYSGLGSPAGRSEIDIGNDGSPEHKTDEPSGTFGSQASIVDLDLPAGTTPVVLTIELDLEPGAAGISLQTGLFTSIHIEPAHAEFVNESAPCGWVTSHATLHGLQLLDGENVQFGIVGSISSDLHFLVLGLQRTAVPLPLAPHCPLLVSPDVLLAMPSSPRMTVPLGALGPGEVLAQTLVLRQVGFPFWPEGLFSTQRLAITIH